MGPVDRTDHWLTGRPAQRMASPEVSLHRASPGDLEELVETVNASLDELRPWMPWAQTPATDTSIGAYLSQADGNWEAGTEFAFAMRGRRRRQAEALLGYCGLHDRIGAGGLEIGYWVRSDCTGRGLATAAAALLTSSALALDGVTRAEIHCDAANTRSAAIPPKLGFRLDRIQSRTPTAPGETDRQMVWVFDPGPDGLEADPVP